MAKVVFTAGRVSGFKCDPGKQQAFLWDVTVPGLGLRATPAGKPSYIFQSEIQSKTIRMTIGRPDAWSIEQARTKAKELQRQIDDGRDPRAVKAEVVAADAAMREAEKGIALTLGEVWFEYLADRKDKWGDHHYQRQLTLGDAGGIQAKRSSKGTLTVARPIHPLMNMPLAEVTKEVIEAWAVQQAKTRKSVARTALVCLKTFFTWCMEHKVYGHLVPVNPAQTKRAKEAFGKPTIRSDVLQREQLSVWFSAVQKIPNRTISAYLQVLLLTGARSVEIIEMKWDDINFMWKGIQIRDKIDGSREIPLTPYVAHLLASLPHRNEWVFASANILNMDEKNIERRSRWAAKHGTSAPAGEVQVRSASGHITPPAAMHSRACRAAGLPGLTKHGLRRSFKSLSEWLELPVGVVAQIQGHKPSATAEKHYTVRPLELLRLHHERFEAWILEQAGVQFDAKAEPGKLQLVPV